MSYGLGFLPEASAEVECVVGDYEAQLAGLGRRFRLEVEAACAAIVENPLLWRLRPEGFRRLNLPGFSYYIAFTIEEGSIIVIAVAHASRRPDYFRNRLW
jgi:toxin ParE2